MIRLTVEQVKKLDTLQLIDVMLDFVKEGIGKLVSLDPDQDIQKKELLRTYQQELAVLSDFKNVLKTVADELAKRPPADATEMNEFLDIEEKARSHSLALFEWIEHNQANL